ncbi:hypothetical protein GE09DRAFT_1096793 [Coniochaeta sp. 2T2.1]|nr:hypothetical protein GE09DRAFT_1096793 [Coniochaeta sp. 2T2.1]
MTMASMQTLRMEAEARRRKVRKGTHSCWECRRRKIKCQYDSTSDTICLPCQARGSQCQSQEYVDESKTIPPPDRRLAQRLGRLEEMMEKLMDHIKPQSSTTGGSSLSRTPSTSPSPSAHEDDVELAVDVLDRSINEDTPLGKLLGIHNATPAAAAPSSSKANSTPGSATAPQGRLHRYAKLSKTLYTLFPSQADIDTVVEGTGGAYFVTTMFHNRAEILAGKCETPSSLRIIPPISSHPTVLARRLVQLAICMQQLAPSFNRGELNLKHSLSKTMARITSTVQALVTSNDEVIGTAEGLQTLALQGIWHSNAGNLRKAWLSNRKALSLAQLMGIDRPSPSPSRAFKYADHTANPNQHATAAGVYYRIVYCDRFISLLLGLPIGTYDTSFATDEAMANDDAVERLNKAHTLISARIVDRNADKTSQAYTLTQQIDFELESAGNAIPPSWWAEPSLDPFASPIKLSEMVCVFIHQIHHFDLLILLHLPYMLRDPAESRYEYSRVTCVRASREVLKRFVSFRTIINSAFSCRHVDYSALIAAMTLLLSYLGGASNKLVSQHHPTSTNVPVWRPHPGTAAQPPSCAIDETAHPVCSYHEDRKLIEAVRERMRHVAIINDDKLSQESADIIAQLMPVLEVRDKGAESATLDCLHLSVPYLGTVSIGPKNVGAAGQTGGSGSGQGQRRVVAPYEISFPDVPHGMGQGGMGVPMEQQMDLSDLEHMFMSGGHDGNGGMGGGFGQFDPQMLPDADFPELVAEAEDWTLQGVDTTYWSMLNGGML